MDKNELQTQTKTHNHTGIRLQNHRNSNNKIQKHKTQRCQKSGQYVAGRVQTQLKIWRHDRTLNSIYCQSLGSEILYAETQTNQESSTCKLQN